MAASTSSSTQAIKIQTPDPFFSSFQEPKEALFNQTDRNFQSSYPKWETEYETLEKFQVDVRNRGHDFQNEKVKPLPKKAELEGERDGYLTKYWAFRGTYEKIDMYSSELSKRIDFLTPQVRAFYEEERLKNEQPELLEQIKQYEGICKGYIEKLQEFSGKINTLKGKFFTCIHKETYNVNWALQRFCQIVDNNGKPLTAWTRGWDNLTTPVIPKLKETSSLVDSSQIKKEREIGCSDSTASTPQQTGSSSEKGKEAPSSQAPPQQPQPQASSSQNKDDSASKSNEAPSSQAATQQPQPEASSSQNKDAPASATTSDASDSNGAGTEQAELFETAHMTEDSSKNASIAETPDSIR